MTTAQADPGAHAASASAAGSSFTSRGHVPALDGVRGIAILLVMIYHFINSLGVLGVRTPLLQVFDLGWCGVDIFFALSGFLITGILLDSKTSTNYFKNFYIRRVLRIFPLYYAALVVVFVLRAALPDAGVWGAHASAGAPGSLLWPATFLQNAAVALAGGRAAGITTHYWSLAVEEHFYLLWPLLVWLARTRRQVLALAVAAGALSILARALVLWHGPPLYLMFGLTPLRLDGLAIGAITAVLVRDHSRRTLIPWALALLALALAAGAALILLRHTTSQTDAALWLFAYPLASVCTAAMVILCLGGGRVAATLSLAPLRWFGKYSFGLYVWHPIIGVLLFHSAIAIAHPGQPAGRVLAAAAAVLVIDLLVAWLSFELWEKRFLALKGVLTPQPAPAAALSPAAVVHPANIFGAADGRPARP